MMNDQRAEQVMAIAKAMQAETVEHVGSAVHVRFRGFGPDRAEVGSVRASVSRRGVRLAALRHTQCAFGVAWSCRVAQQLARLDEAARRESHWN